MVTAILAIRDAHTLRATIGLHETWWVAGSLALVLMLASFVLYARYHNSGEAKRARPLIVVLGVLCVLFYLAAIRLATAHFWTPATDPQDFHQLIAAPNYRALDAWTAAHPGEIADIPTLREATKDETIRLNDHLEWPYFTDAFGRPLRLELGIVLQTADDVEPQQLPRPDRPTAAGSTGE